MQASEVKDALKKQAGGADFITVGQVGKVFGIKDYPAIKNRYLHGLECVDNKYYFIPDVVRNIMERRA